MTDEIKQLSDLDFLLNQRPMNLPDPVLGPDAANKSYVDNLVDSIAQGLAWKDSARAASVADVTVATPGATLDGVSLVLGDRVLLKDQTDATENGIYVFDTAGTPLVRTVDADVFDELEAAVVTVEEGTNAGATYRQSEVNGTIGVDDITWVAFASVVPLATETIAGRAEIATQVEVDAGTDDQRFVTPLKLASSQYAKLKFATDFGDGVAKTFVLNHALGTLDVNVDLFENSTGETVNAKIERTDANNVTVKVKGAAPTAAEYRAVILG